MKWTTTTSYNIPINYERQKNTKRKVKEVRAYLVTKSYRPVSLPINENITDRFVIFCNTSEQ